jgi:hypothetical protein
MAEGSDSPWFPGFKVYRQASDGSWKAALESVGAEFVSRSS